MSLLLKALKQAGDKSAGGGARNPSATLADSLSLEPISGPASDGIPYAGRENAAPRFNSAQAAWYTPWLSGQRSIVPVIAVLAALFMLIYGAFVYWQTRTPPAPAIAVTQRSSAPVIHSPVTAPTPPAAASSQVPVSALPEIQPAIQPAPAAVPTRPAKTDPMPQWGSGDVIRDSLSTEHKQTAVTPRATYKPLPFAMQTERINPQLQDAYQAYQAGRTREARNLYLQIPDGERNVDVQLGLAAIALRDNNTPAAAHYYQRVLELDPRNITANSALINMMGDADPNASEQRLKTLIASQPSAQLYFSLGNLYAGQMRWPDAEQAYFEAYQKNPANADYAYNLAVSLEHINQSKPALNYYQKARDLMQPGNVQFDPVRLDARINQLKARQE
ncbi:tetratricopeptide repeat protein [Sulfuriferula sp. GW1]|uniref:tetratricopeptide repeat protein n=1 Tax=Sulfuriferula sp. GW1 TaxID=3345111 RepID=UPI0039B0204F